MLNTLEIRSYVCLLGIIKLPPSALIATYSVGKIGTIYQYQLLILKVLLW